MSLNGIFTDSNNRELFAHSITTTGPNYGQPIGFRASLEGGSTLNVNTGYANPDTFVINYGTLVSDNINYGSDSFNSATGIYTIPITGLWHIEGSILYTALGGTGAANNIVVGISSPGDTSSPFAYATTYQDQQLLNACVNCTAECHFTQGQQLQMYTQQGSGVTQTIGGASGRYCQFSAVYLGGPSNQSPS